MQEETVVFKLDVSNERIKQKAMKVVWMISRVTLVDIKEKGTVKVRGNFDKMEMGLKLKKIDKSVDIIDSMGIGEQNYNNMQELIFKGILDVRKAITVVWKFSGVTSVELKGYDQVEVRGKFNNLEMVKKLKKVYKYVNILKVGEYVERPPDVGNMFTGSSNGPKSPERSNSMPVPQPQVNQQPAQIKKQEQEGGLFAFLGLNQQQPQVNQPPNNRGWNNQQPQNKKQEQGGFLANLGLNLNKKQPQFNQHDQGGGIFGFLGLNKQEPQINHPPQNNWAQIQKEREDKLRIEKERAEKEKAEKKKRMDRAKAEKLRADREEAERQRIIQENADKQRISTSRTGGQNTLTQTLGLGFTRSSTTANPYTSQSTGASGSKLPRSTTNTSASRSTSASGSTHNQSSIESTKKYINNIIINIANHKRS